MMQVSLDKYDRKILAALVQNGALTNAQLSEIVNLSPSQCSRRRINLETKGVIQGYHARLNSEAIGISLRAIVRINLQSHAEDDAKEFLRLIEQQQEVAEAFSVSGDSDYVLILKCENLRTFADFIHSKLLPQKNYNARVHEKLSLQEVEKIASPSSMELLDQFCKKYGYTI